MPDQERIAVPPRSKTESAVQKLRDQQQAIDEEPRVDKKPEEVMTLAEKKARLAQLLKRGMVADRLEVRNPNPSKVYEWIRETDQDIERHLALGFLIELEDGTEMNRLHGTGDNVIRIGDVILMSTSKEHYELIEQVKAEKKARKSTLGKEEYLRRARMANTGQVPSAQVPILDPLGVSKELEEV